MGLAPPLLGQRREVGEEVVDHLEQRLELAVLVAARHLRVGRAEQLLGEREHPRVVALGQPEDGQDHLERERHRDVAGEVARAAQLLHAVDRRDGQLLQAPVQPGDALGQEPVGGHGPEDPVVGVVHVDEGAQQVALLGVAAVGLEVLEHRPRCVAELLRVDLHLEHVGVLGQHPERCEVGVLDEVDGVLTPQHRAGAVEPLVVGVGRGRHEHLARLARRHGLDGRRHGSSEGGGVELRTRRSRRCGWWRSPARLRGPGPAS